MGYRVELMGQRRGGIATTAPPANARPVEMLDNDAADPVRRTIDRGVQIGADVLNDGHGGIGQVDLNAAEFVNTAARSVRVAETHHDALDAVAVARQHESQPAPGVVS